MPQMIDGRGAIAAQRLFWNDHRWQHALRMFMVEVAKA
jgi:hypothetical protein